MRVNTCPCCNSALLRHARKGGLYWFCTNCWQEFPYRAIAEHRNSTPKIDKSKNISISQTA